MIIQISISFFNLPFIKPNSDNAPLWDNPAWVYTSWKEQSEQSEQNEQREQREHYTCLDSEKDPKTFVRHLIFFPICIPNSIFIPRLFSEQNEQSEQSEQSEQRERHTC